MDEKFSNEITERLGELVADLRYFHKPSGELRVPQIVETMLSPKKKGYQEGDILPLVCWSIHSGKLSYKKPQPFSVNIVAGVMVDESQGEIIDQIRLGSLSIMELIKAIGHLAKNRWVGGYKLQLPFNFTIGDEAGNQPHPIYWAEFELSFLVP